MIKSLKIILWNEEIGRLAWDEHRRLSYFIYNPDFIKKGLNISPLVAPIDGTRGLLPVWGEDAKISEANRERRVGKIDVKSLADLAERIFIERENARIMPEESITMQSLLTVGTSAGGRQPKAIIAINRETGEIRSGQIAGLEGYDYYLLKFGNSEYCSAELEMTYYKLATLAGINMMPSELYPVDGNNHFLTKRFDRDGEKKIHTQTLAAIYPDAESYEQLITVCRKLRLPEADCQEIFRRMVFNILSNNTDDHNKNFSFVMNEDGSWRLAPAYDITYIIDRGGYLPNRDHCMYIRAKLHDITRSDVIEFARDNGIRRPDAIIRDIVSALKQFRAIATDNGVSESWIGRVESTIVEHLKAWGEWEYETADVAIDINGHTVSNMHVEQTYKGNYHLLANIDGAERKFVISQNKEEFASIRTNRIDKPNNRPFENTGRKVFQSMKNLIKIAYATTED